MKTITETLSITILWVILCKQFCKWMLKCLSALHVHTFQLLSPHMFIIVIETIPLLCIIPLLPFNYCYQLSLSTLSISVMWMSFLHLFFSLSIMHSMHNFIKVIYTFKCNNSIWIFFLIFLWLFTLLLSIFYCRINILPLLFSTNFHYIVVQTYFHYWLSTLLLCCAKIFPLLPSTNFQYF